MISSNLRLMPEQPGKGPPSSAPLSVEDADRLAESFTPFWEDDGASATTAAPAPVVAPAVAPVIAQSSATATPLGVRPAPLTLPKKPTNKQTLLGMAPLPGTPAPAAAALPSAMTQPMPIVATSATATPPGPPVAAKSPHKQTLLGFSPALAAPPAPLAPPGMALAAPVLSELPAEVVAAALPPVAPTHEPLAAPLAVQGAANVPGYATKYTPKDGPATPAVVIAPEAQSSPEANERPLSETQPSRVRPAPAPASVAALPLAASVTGDIDDIYQQKRRTGLWIAASIAVVLLLGAVVGIHALSDDATAPGAAASAASAMPVSSASAASATSTPEEPSAVAPPVVAAPTVAPNPPEPSLSPTATDTPEPASPQGTTAHAKSVKSKSGAAQAPAARPATHTATTATFPAEASTPAPKSGKSVIVRDAPF